MKRLAAARDVLLGLALVAYVSVYLVWAIIAWRNHLGPLPLLDAQYVVAGVPPILLICLVIGLIRLNRHMLSDVWPALLRERSVAGRVVVALGYPIVTVAPFLLFLYFELHPNRFLTADWAHVSAFVSLLVFCLLAACSPMAVIAPSLVDALISRAGLLGQRPLKDVLVIMRAIAKPIMIASRAKNAVGIPLLLGALGLGWYALVAYPALPQAIGGARPRNATIDIALKELSPEAQEELLGGVLTPKELVVRTCRLQVYFAGNTVLLVGMGQSVQEPRFEIPRSSIKLIRWQE